MLLRKPAVLLTSSNAISTGLTSQAHPACHHLTHTTPPCSLHRRRRRANPRFYSTVNDDTRNNPHEHLAWPDPGDSRQPPTPYQIFNQERGEPYSKRRFYELVKLYHPDRQPKPAEDSAESRSSRGTTLERYRLVIAANSILSDPLKREAYDLYGAGWNYQNVADLPPGEREKYKYTTYHRWRTDGSAGYQWPTDQDPMYNATWEDWERWYRQHYERHYQQHYQSSSRWSSGYFYSGRPRRSPLYASNHAFISAVFILAALGGVGQATRAQDTNRWRLERTQVMNDRASESLMQARQDTLERKGSGETKDKRIRRFLSEHDGYDEGEFDARSLRQGDDEGLCASGAVKDKDQPKFWRKPPENR